MVKVSDPPETLPPPYVSGPAARPIIAVHGGAWAIPDDLRDASLAGVAAAADAGHAALEESALDAVEAAVRVLEADPVFNAGRGASLNSVGEVELDAVIMDGRTLGAGAVAAIGPVRHPVSVARRLMEQTEHVLLVGAGATAFAREAGFTIVPADELVTEAARAEWAQLDAYGTSVNTLYNTAARRPTAEVRPLGCTRDGCTCEGCTCDGCRRGRVTASAHRRNREHRLSID
jgi:beta-aspartyl-peptidase (threonine type)